MEWAKATRGRPLGAARGAAVLTAWEGMGAVPCAQESIQKAYSMMRPPPILWGSAGVLLGLVLTLALATGQPAAVCSAPLWRPCPPLSASAEDHAPEAPASPWLRQRGWERVWPLFVEGRSLQVTFAGPHRSAFCRWSPTRPIRSGHAVCVDPQHYPLLAITWAVERFPSGRRWISWGE